MLESYLIYFVFLTVAAIGVAVPYVAISTIKQVKKLVAESDSKFDQIRATIVDLKDTMSLPVEKLDEIEKRSRRLTERLEQLELREQNQRQYEQAIKLIKRGSSVEEVMASCGLNRGEVELITTMHDNEHDYKSAS